MGYGAGMTARPKPSQPATYTMLWPAYLVKELVGKVDGRPLRYVFGRGNAQTDFARSRIAPGDLLVPLHVSKGKVCPIARMRVSYKGTIEAWRKAHPEELKGELYPSRQLLVGDEGTPMQFFRPLSVELLRALRYDSKEPRALKLDEDGLLTTHTGIEGVYRLCAESADELLWLEWL